MAGYAPAFCLQILRLQILKLWPQKATVTVSRERLLWLPASYTFESFQKKPLKAIDKLSNGLKIWLQIWNATQNLLFGTMKKALC